MAGRSGQQFFVGGPHSRQGYFEGSITRARWHITDRIAESF